MNTHKQKLIVALTRRCSRKSSRCNTVDENAFKSITTHEWKKAERERCEYVARLADVWDEELQDEEAL